MASLLQVENFTRYMGEVKMFDNISFQIEEGQKLALIARNGAGKTTLLNILSGKEKSDGGTISWMKDIKVGFLEQEPVLNDKLSIIDQLFLDSGPVAATIEEYEKAVLVHDEKRLQKAMEAMDFHHAWDYEARMKQMLSVLKIDRYEQLVGTLSGGQKKRLALASVLINQPDLLILDEPTNHLDLETIEWLEEYLMKNVNSLLMVTHDRYFLDRVCNRILELDESQLFPYSGNYSLYLEKREERLANQEVRAEKARNLMHVELEWMRRQPKARSHKAKYRVDAFSEVKEAASYQRSEKEVQFAAAQSRLGSKIIEIEHINKSYGDLCLVKDFSYVFSRGEKVGIVGVNGVGKSTFLNLITSALSPDSGKIETGETVVYGYYRQEEQVFDESKRVIDVVTDIAEVVSLSDGTTIGVSQFLNQFMFPYETQYNVVGKLSVGEKRRLYLCSILMRNPNFLILDEPTNHLDIITLNVLEEYLAHFGGCLIVVSHDRFFMDKVVDHLFIFKGEGVIKDFPGSYSDYRAFVEFKEREEEAEKKQAAAASKPTEVPKAQSVAKKKASFKEQREYEQLTNEIDALETEKSKLEEILNSGITDHAKLMETSNRIAEIISLLDTKTERWIELSEIVEG
jgi:ATP-binding cassette subfamily F protein uup